MSIDDTWGNFFKAEIKTSGFKLFAQEKVSIPSGSDSDILAYVKATPPLKVRLSTDDIGSETFTANCSCPVAQKSQFCKHVWATLLCVEQRYPDFLSAKRVIEKPSSPVEVALSGSKDTYQATAKARASEYRKEQYQKQKARAKDLKWVRQGRETPVKASVFPAAVDEALAYFAVNGFPMVDGPSEVILSEAKRKLSRVFHPDKGGSNEEIVELNRNCELILRYLRS